jgi:hypothetical protein
MSTPKSTNYSTDYGSNTLNKQDNQHQQPVPMIVESDKIIIMTEPEEKSPFRMLYTVFHLIVSVFAIYLSFKCKKSFDLLSFLAALFFPYIYILYKFINTDGQLCGITEATNKMLRG